MTDEKFDSLRARAEKQLAQSELSTNNVMDIKAVLEELAVHQHELEIQNHELIEAQTQLHINYKNFHNLFHNAPVAYVATSKRGVVIKANAKFEQIVSVFDNQTIIGKTLVEFISTDYRLLFENWFHSSAKVNTPVVVQLKAGKSEDDIYVQIMSSDVFDINGEENYLLVLSDVTELFIAEERLKLASSVIEVVSEGCMITDANLNIVYVNPAFTEITGFKEHDVLGRKPDILSSGMHDENFFKNLWRGLNDTGRWQGEIWNRTKSGNVYPEWLSISVIYDPHNNPIRYVGLFNDISEQKNTEELIRRQANYDHLTDLPNRSLLLDRLERAIISGNRTQKAGAILFLDLDKFKEINDSLGHAAGDQLLIQVADRLTNQIRESDTIARLGGDEFVILIENCDLNKATDTAQIVTNKTISAFSAPFIIDESICHVSVSVGITIFPHDSNSVSDLLMYADQAMYQSKALGNNRYTFFTDDLREKLDTKTQTQSLIRKAIAEDQFVMHYQPIVNEDGKLLKLESLVRWKHPSGQIYFPDSFIPVAEESDLIIELGQKIVELALTDLYIINQIDASILLGINFSSLQILGDDSFTEKLLQVIKDKSIKATNICLEVTESVLLNDIEKSTQIFNRLKQEGVRITMDDFGTGFSSLSYIQNIEFDSVKVDKSFVIGLTHDSTEFQLCKTIQAMASALNLTTVAEGVETQEQFELLNGIGIDMFQGYLFGRPKSLDETLSLLKRINQP